MLTIGSLCSGYGGLDMAIESFFGARTKWFSEFEAAPSKVLAAHWPTVPNLGDMTKIDWAAVPKVDIVAGGTPCQDLSGAGKRKGMTEGTRSNLWVQMREAVAVIRPSIVVWENVRGAFSAYASSEVESEPGLLGAYGPDRPALRALGRVLGDLSDLGYDTEWVGVRASDAGAPHARFRVFVIAYAQCGESADAEYVLGYGTGRAWHGRPEPANSTAGNPNDARLERRPVSAERAHERAAADTGCERLGEHAREPSAEEAGPGGGDVIDGISGSRSATDWGPYRPAIERWERVLDRFAPAPTEASVNGSQRLSPRFVEFMMGLPDGWVTDPAIGLTRNSQLKALGNGVVPQQAELALSIMWPRVMESLGAVA